MFGESVMPEPQWGHLVGMAPCAPVTSVRPQDQQGMPLLVAIEPQ